LCALLDIYAPSSEEKPLPFSGGIDLQQHDAIAKPLPLSYN